MMKTTKSKLISAASALSCLAATYFVSTQPEPGFAAWLLGLPAAMVVAITALVRGNEIPVEVESWRGHLRRAGFFLTGMYAISFMARPMDGVWPGWYGLFILYGVAATWITTPNMPPWWDYVSGKKKLRQKDIL